MIPYISTLVGLLLLCSSPQYQFRGISFLWIFLPLAVLFTLRLLLQFVRTPLLLGVPTIWFSVLLRWINNSIYGALAYRVLHARLNNLDWVIQTPLLSIRRIWSYEELLEWVKEFHTLRPGYPRPSMTIIEQILAHSDYSLPSFQQQYVKYMATYIEWHAQYGPYFDEAYTPALLFVIVVIMSLASIRKLTSLL